MENTSAQHNSSHSTSLVDRLYALTRIAILLFLLTAVLLFYSACSILPFDLPLVRTGSPNPAEIEAQINPSETPELPSATPETKQPSATATQTPHTEDTTAHNTPATVENVVLVTPELTITRSTQFEETSDLLFLSDGNLMRWDHVTNFFTVLVENVVDFSVNEAASHIALLKSANVSRNGEELFHLAVLDLNTKQLQYLLEDTPRLFHISISPDGEWVAYKDEQEDGLIFGIHLDESQYPHELGACNAADTAKCDQLQWSPVSNDLLWSDIDGIWMANFEDISVRQVYSNTVQVADPDGGVEEIDVTFNTFRWSPSGRFVLMDIVPSNYGVRWQGILDTGPGRIIQVPETYDFSNQDACATWTEDGSLLVGHSGGILDPPLPYLDLWKIVPTSEDILLLEEVIDLDSSIYPALPNQDDLDLHYFPNWLRQSDEDQFTFGLCQVGSDTSPVLYQLNIENGDVNEIIVIPYNSMEILWAPDGSGALILGKNREVIYAPFDGSLMRDLRMLFGDEASGFKWLPPTPRS
jgi:hypothetical protein